MATGSRPREEKIEVQNQLATVPLVRRGDVITASSENVLRSTVNLLAGATRPSYRPRRERVQAAGTAIIEIKLRGAMESAADAQALDTLYGTANDEILELWNAKPCSSLVAAKMKVNDINQCMLEADTESFIQCFPAPPMMADSFKDADGNQIYGPGTLADNGAPVFLAFKGVRGLTLFAGYGEVWIPPADVPRQEDYC